MRIQDLDSLSDRLLPQLVTFGASDGDPPQDAGVIRRLRKMGHPASDYWGVYAVEGDQLLSRVETLHLAFTGRAGPQTVLGISDVLTRPSAVGRGFARTLLREVHRREVARGRTWSFLWTHRTWGAHRLYLELGYRDVYSPVHALRHIPRGMRPTPPSGYRWSVARERDAGRLERLVETANRDRLGFVPRSPGWARIRFAFGWRKPENHRILFQGSKPVGYALISDERDWNLSVNEVILTSTDYIDVMLRSLEGLARGRWLTFQETSFPADAAGPLREFGYTVGSASHEVLMAKHLRPHPPEGEDLLQVFADPLFSGHRGDMF